MLEKKVYTFDTTLRDGTQSADISLTVRDKLAIVDKLDQIGIDYIEVGFPASNPKDEELFGQLKKRKYEYSKIVAFGRTRYKDAKAEEDKNLRLLIEAGTDSVCIFGKSSSLHVQKVIETSLDNNLAMIFESIKYLKNYFSEVIFDGEHFFDGYQQNAPYALDTLKAAEEAGADFLVLCDTNGGFLPKKALEVVQAAAKEVNAPLGVHFHNDSGCAVANSVYAIEMVDQVKMVQGTINGYGERCGNADLCQIIPSLEIKLGKQCLKDGNLKHITSLSRFVSEIANQTHNSHQPFVGQSAFAHKGGMHVSGVSKISEAFEHIEPELVGNTRRILISELSGKKSIILKAREFGINLENDLEKVSEILNRVQNMEHKGYQFEAADGSFRCCR